MKEYKNQLLDCRKTVDNGGVLKCENCRNDLSYL